MRLPKSCERKVWELPELISLSGNLSLVPIPVSPSFTMEERPENTSRTANFPPMKDLDFSFYPEQSDIRTLRIGLLWLTMLCTSEEGAWKGRSFCGAKGFKVPSTCVQTTKDERSLSAITKFIG